MIAYQIYYFTLMQSPQVELLAHLLMFSKKVLLVKQYMTILIILNCQIKLDKSSILT